jgi:F-type H+-transporting ATPase subunit delta
MASASFRYARALADVVFQKNLDAAKALLELQAICALTSESEDLRRVWENPALPPEQKRGLLDAIVARSGISRPVRNFIAVLIDHGRMPLLPRITRQFETEVMARLNLAEAEITSARDLGDEEKRTLESQIARMTGKQVRARYHRDPALLGGAVIRIGSTIYDGSVLGQLHKIREQLAGA